MPTDLLTDVLRHNGLSARKLALSTMQPNLALQFPCERSVGVHVVLRGPIYLHAADQPCAMTLARGDMVLMARGVPHAISLSAELTGQDQAYLDIRHATDLPSQEQAAHVLSGVYQFWHTPLHPFFAEMPAWYVLHSEDLPRLSPLAMVSELLAQELRSIEPGSGIVTNGLLDVVFAYVMREVVARQAIDQPGWCQGASDPQIGHVMALLQEEMDSAWTLDELARRSGLSRTALAGRFRAATGDTPLNYLRTLRMQHARQLLVETSQPLDAIAGAVGYQDAFGFSKVFKRTTGLSPRAFRQQDAAERASPRRFLRD
ncbi:AraC family transcriptional regulator [Pseudomonas sp. BN605]|uniref:HTH araC/xylS-type domain-containing protein n=1 Tax=Pseudomonas hunanensis TaxID=1247546 RepID=A0ABD6MWM4_9PSED|nr:MULTISPECIES: AraC family transcriptional regulator [Pseudomonas]MDH4847928.1 AraC family transcriptional regulator [Pseudomonas sp. BN605]NWL45644.1 hypothetical protein [Pseudomonas hunanensis]